MAVLCPPSISVSVAASFSPSLSLCLCLSSLPSHLGQHRPSFLHRHIHFKIYILHIYHIYNLFTWDSIGRRSSIVTSISRYPLWGHSHSSPDPSLNVPQCDSWCSLSTSSRTRVICWALPDGLPGIRNRLFKIIRYVRESTSIREGPVNSFNSFINK